MVIHEKAYTADDLWELSKQPGYEEKFLELIDGEIEELSPSSGKSGVIGLRIGRFLQQYVDDARLGYVGGADTGFELSPKNVLSPDAGYISFGRHPEYPKRYFIGAPDLAVEVVSPTASLRKVQRKARKYLEHGTKLVWIVYPDEETVDVCRLSESGSLMIDEVGKDGVLDGGDALPFTLPLTELFRD
ncbi:MAG: Uma2 family endonuclease [Chloroflexota bacterium]|nr:MAG: Uma2 family endonuclease [Chloroflexota bacterium]